MSRIFIADLLGRRPESDARTCTARSGEKSALDEAVPRVYSCRSRIQGIGAGGAPCRHDGGEQAAARALTSSPAAVDKSSDGSLDDANKQASGAHRRAPMTTPTTTIDALCPQHQIDDVARGRAERDPDAEFGQALLVK